LRDSRLLAASEAARQLAVLPEWMAARLADLEALLLLELDLDGSPQLVRRLSALPRATEAPEETLVLQVSTEVRDRTQTPRLSTWGCRSDGPRQFQASEERSAAQRVEEEEEEEEEDRADVETRSAKTARLLWHSLQAREAGGRRRRATAQRAMTRVRVLTDSTGRMVSLDSPVVVEAVVRAVEALVLVPRPAAPVGPGA